MLLVSGVWFSKPKYMPTWLYRFFGTEIAPLIFKKEGRCLQKPSIFCDLRKALSPASFWVNPPEPAVLLAKCFEPSVHYRPRIFLWLPHFFVELRCPFCSAILEKNGALRPRRVTDVRDSYYIIAWAYYCRKGCRKHLAGWSQTLIKALPRYLRLAFPAVLSHKGGLSHEVISLLRVGNQHKMGPNGVRALLVEMHTTHFSKLQTQYLEAVFDVVHSQENRSFDKGTQESLHDFIASRFTGFGDFGSPEQFAGFVPGERYLSEMMNKSIEGDEADADQHTAYLAPDQIAIDDSHKVRLCDMTD